mmetsp:Transcript_30837/g.62951  ORF Transcript_30837/g.62951 Transcript_30837/m.62951 type:complete len:263 (+) Transcript_30837:919-1707(+)
MVPPTGPLLLHRQPRPAPEAVLDHPRVRHDAGASHTALLRPRRERLGYNHGGGSAGVGARAQGGGDHAGEAHEPLPRDGHGIQDGDNGPQPKWPPSLQHPRHQHPHRHRRPLPQRRPLHPRRPRPRRLPQRRPLPSRRRRNRPRPPVVLPPLRLRAPLPSLPHDPTSGQEGGGSVLLHAAIHLGGRLRPGDCLHDTGGVRGERQDGGELRGSDVAAPDDGGGDAGGRGDGEAHSEEKVSGGGARVVRPQRGSIREVLRVVGG